MKNKRKITHIVGVDEAGRGPLAGPVSIGVACVPHDFNWKIIPGVGDSKKVSPQKRELIFKQAHVLKKEGKLNFAVILISAAIIDRKGITYAVRNGIDRAFKKLNLDPNQVEVRLDGLLKAPNEFIYQRTIIKGDAKEKVIGLASILAKVTRDRMMIRAARSYPQYGFEIHKGYGTKNHRASLQIHGVSNLHRITFIKNSLLS